MILWICLNCLVQGLVLGKLGYKSECYDYDYDYSFLSYVRHELA